MKPIFLLFITLLLFTCNKNNAPKPDQSGTFIKYYGGVKSSAGFSVKQTGDGGFIITGSTISEGRLDKDLYLVKTDANGNKQWDRRFGGIYDEEGFDLIVDQQGNYLAAGYVKNKKDSSNCLIVKYNKEGILLRSFVFGLPGSNEVAKFITTDNEKFLLIAGTKESPAGSKDMYMAKINLDSVIWERAIGLNQFYDDMGTVVKTPKNDLLWCGTVSKGSYTDIRICMTDQYSNLYWSYSIGEGNGLSQTGREIQPTQDGNYIIAGSQTDAGGNTSVYLAKIDPYGKLLWHKQPGGIGKSANSIYPTSDGGFIIAGTTNNNYLLMKTDGEGNLLWQQSYGGKGTDEANRVLQTHDGDLLMIGTINIADTDVLGLIKTDGEGKLE